MATSPEVRLNGIATLSSSLTRWGEREGTAARQELFELKIKDQKAPLAGAAIDGVTLILRNKFIDFEYQKLSVTGFLPGSDPFTVRVSIEDRRWVWPYKHILRRFNVRREGGFKRRGKWGEQLQQKPTREVQFAIWSLDNGREFTPKRALIDVLVNGLDIPAQDVIFDSSLDSTLQDLRLDNFTIDDPGDVAVQRLLNAIPGSSLFIDKLGKVIIYSTATDFEKREIEKGGPEIVQGGHIDLVTNEETRAREVHVFFTIEAEVRFDYIEKEKDPSRETISSGGVDPRDMDNVLPVPDFELTISSGERLAQGTWIELNQYLNSVTIRNGRGLLQNLTLSKWHSLIRQAFIPEMDLWGALLIAGLFDANSDEANWSTRIAALQRNYRRTYRLNKRWMDRILSLRPYLVATIDPVKGQRAPAMAFADHAIKYTKKGMVHLLRNKRRIAYAHNVDGFAVLLDDARPSPARVIIEDPDQGIVHVDYQLDPFNMNEIIFPSKLINIPGMDPDDGKRGDPITFDSAPKRGGKRPQLSQDHRIAVLLTCVPASPNNKGQLFKVVIKPRDIANRLPPSLRKGLTNAKGPVKEIRVGAGLETARVRWKDDRSSDTERIFGVLPGTPNFNDLVINSDGGQPVAGAASVEEIARAIAAAYYAGQHDRLQGSETIAMNAEVQPAGSLGDVTHEVNRDGAMTTSLILPDKIAELNVFAFMDESTRRIILREVQPRKN